MGQGPVGRCREGAKKPRREGGAAKYSEREKTRYDFTKSFEEQINDWKKGIFPQRDSLLLGATPQIWEKVGFNALPVTINQTHIDYALNGSKDADHYIGEEATKDLPNLIQRPVAIIQSQSDPTRGVVIVRKDHNGKKIIAAVEVDGFGHLNNQRIDSNAITSVYAATNALNTLNSAIQHTSTGKKNSIIGTKEKPLLYYRALGFKCPGACLKTASYTEYGIKARMSRQESIPF